MASTVLITGASQGIGRAIAQSFAENHYNVVLAARQSDRLDAAAQELEAAGHSALAILTDVKDPVQVEHLVQKAIAHYGAIDVLVNNAGIYISGAVEEFSLADWHQAIDTNLWGYIHTTHAILPHFLERQAGTLVNIGSVGGKISLPYLVPYTTTKFAVTGLTQALRSELSPKGIQVVGIYPNLIKSNFLERAIFRGKDDQDTRDRYDQVDKILKVPGIETPADVAKAVLHAVKHKQNKDVVVGSANMATAFNTVFPSLMQKMFNVIFKNRDHSASH